ncbi:MAG: hypothetical protein WCO65_00940 [bacterium]
MVKKISLQKILSKNEIKIFDKYSTPSKIQDYINSIPMRHDDNEPIVRSPRATISKNEASCIEGALLACVMLAYHGYETYLLDLKVDTKNNIDSDHVVALFVIDGHIGSISKTNHSVLRFREPIYLSAREIAMSYFHEYFLSDGKKNLRSFSNKFPIFKKFGIEWITSDADLYEIACALDDSPHQNILTPKMIRNLRKADDIEIRATNVI